MTASANLISGIVIKKSHEGCILSKSLAQNKKSPTFVVLCLGWTLFAFRFATASETYCFRKNRGFNAKGEPSEKKIKALGWCCEVERFWRVL